MYTFHTFIGFELIDAGWVTPEQKNIFTDLSVKRNKLVYLKITCRTLLDITNMLATLQKFL